VSVAPVRLAACEIVEVGAPGGVRAVQSPLPSSGCTPVGTTLGVSFRAVVGLDGEEEMEVVL
jgi:hypothetical protein